MKITITTEQGTIEINSNDFNNPIPNTGQESINGEIKGRLSIGNTVLTEVTYDSSGGPICDKLIEIETNGQVYQLLARLKP